MTDPDSPNLNPDVRPARWYEWTGWWSLALALLNWVQESLGLWVNPPSWVTLVLIALPFVIRFIREKVSGVPSSFRRRP